MDAGGGGSDAWDGSSIGMPGSAPGGASVNSERVTPGPTYLTYLRIQDTGEPRDHDSAANEWADPGNRKIYFAHNLATDIGELSNTILNTGVTLNFRARVSPVGSGVALDPMYADTGGEMRATPPGTPWVANGYLGHDGGKANFGICQRTADGVKNISFSLAIAGVDEHSDQSKVATSGLYMNSLNGIVPSGDVDPWQKEGTMNVLAIAEVTMWHEFYITIDPDTTGASTHRVMVWMDGDIVDGHAPTGVFLVTAGSGSDYSLGHALGDDYISLSLGNTPQMGAIDADFFGYAAGFYPIPEPATIALLGLGALALLRRRK
jgi:hypothetical protein